MTQSSLRFWPAAVFTALSSLLAFLFVIGWFYMPVRSTRADDLFGLSAAAVLGVALLALLFRMVVHRSRRLPPLKLDVGTFALAGAIAVLGYLMVADGHTYYTSNTGCFTWLELQLGITKDYSWVRSMERAVGPVLLFGAPLLFSRSLKSSPREP
jgi:hypothetical protein